MDRLQFISQENGRMSHLDSIRLACEGGVKWVQLRIKDKPEEDVLKIARLAKELCDAHGTRFTINDFPGVAKEVKAYGLHLGKEDMPLIEARQMIGPILLGGTANTFEDIRKHVKSGADYVGVGPFRFTSTKKKLSPVLGLGGYEKLLNQCEKEGINIPVLAIGGLTLEDIEDLIQAGVYGIAVSSLIALAPDPKGVVEKIYEKLRKERNYYA